MNSSSQELEELYNNAPCGYHSLDSEGRFVRINDTELKMLGYSREEVLGRKFSDLITPESLATFEQNFPIFKQRGWVNDLEFQFIRKDGTILPIALSATAIKDEAGNFLMSRWVVIDISDRKQAEAAFRESEEKYRTLFNSIDEGFCIIEMIFDENEKPVDYRFLEINPSFEQQTGLTDAQGKRMRELAPYHEEHWFEIYGNIALTGEPARFENRAEQLHRWFDMFAFRYGAPEHRQVAILFQDITERKQSEEQLQLSQAKFEALVTNMPGMVYRYFPNTPDRPHHFTFVSQHSYELLELAPETIVQDANAFINLIHPEDLPSFLDSVTHSVEHFLPWRWEGRITTPSGKMKWIQGNSQAQNTPEGNAWDGLLVDISDRKLAELALEQQIAREHLLAEITQAIYQTLDVERILQIAVERIRQFIQTARGLVFRFNPDWSGRVVAESVASGAISILESEITAPCFEERYIEPYRQGRVSAIADLNASDVEPSYKELMAQFQVRANLVVPILQREQLWGLLIAHHCSAPRQWLPEEIELLQQLATQLGIAIQQAELYQNNAEQAALIDIASDAIFVRDLSNRILFWSQGAERMYGWTTEEIRNQLAHEFFYRESLSKLETALGTTIEQGSWNGELKQFTKENKEIIVESRWTLMRARQGNPNSILVVNTDITEKKQLEKQLLHAQRLESIGTLAGRIAHDLNNILTPILTLSQLLQLKIPNLDESSSELLRIVRTNALRGCEIVKQVLLFSSEIESEWELVNFALVLEEVVKLIRETFPKSIVIEDYISPNLWLVQGDSTQLHQVLMNLCVNARDAMPDGGKLVISAENLCLDEQYSRTNLNIELGNYILITVTDTGMGIPPEIIDRIFEPFFTTKEPDRGTGLGLSTVIGIVKNHGGTIEVKSDRSCGTQFQVYLAAAEEIVTTETITGETIPSGRGELILLVDDEAAIREVTKATLENYNYRVITASDGLEAIAVYAQHLQEIEVVLMDLIMPEMDGLTAMRALKKINPNVKLIATSGLATKEKVSAAELIGIKAFLVKPYTAEKLLLNVNEAIV